MPPRNRPRIDVTDRFSGRDLYGNLMKTASYPDGFHMDFTPIWHLNVSVAGVAARLSHSLLRSSG